MNTWNDIFYFLSKWEGPNLDIIIDHLKLYISDAIYTVKKIAFSTNNIFCVGSFDLFMKQGRCVVWQTQVFISKMPHKLLHKSY